MSRTAQKIAVLLASLDPGTAGELLKSAKPERTPEIAAELVLLETSPEAAQAATSDLVREFTQFLQGRRKTAPRQASFARQVLENAFGPRGEEVFSQARRLVDLKDPFQPLRSLEVERIAGALAGEHPQVVALVLLELPPGKSAALIPMLNENLRTEAVSRMTLGERVSPEAKLRVAAMVQHRLEEIRKTQAAGVETPAPVAAPGAPAAGGGSGAAAPSPDAKAKTAAHLRRVALLLRGLAVEVRDGLVKAIGIRSVETSKAVQELMVLWEDLPLVADRSLQAVVRNIDMRKLALALVGADPAYTNRLRANISERARGMIDEETELMKKPKPEEIQEAREELLAQLRQLNTVGELHFEEK